jgi:chemotaxis protein CheZ
MSISAGAAEFDVDLEALFDRIAAERLPAGPDDGRGASAPGGPATSMPAPESLDAPAAAPACAGMADGDAGGDSAHMFRRIGQLTRTLHDALRELGYGRKLASVASTMPGARKRLEHIASLTGRSADTVLEGVERAQALQRSIDEGAGGLRRRWQALYDGATSADDFKALAGDTREFLENVRDKTAATQEHLHQMMMAQDFHDLTGQMIKKIVDVAHTVETSLVELLLEARPAQATPGGRFNGPATCSDAGAETVSSQAQVDQLLDSLGF